MSNVLSKQRNKLKELFDHVTTKLENGIRMINLTTYVKNALITYKDVEPYVKINKEKYNRNIIYKNDKLELVIITWNAKQGSPIHGHPSGGCIYKIMRGQITEYVYSAADHNVIDKTNHYVMADTNYIDNGFGFHKVVNNSKSICVSMHLYSPPYKTLPK